MIRRISDGATFFVIDAHAHTGESSLLRRYRYKEGNKFQVDDLIERMDRHGIDAAVTFAHHSPNTGYAEQNERILAAAVEHPSRVIPFIRLSPHRQENLASRIRDYARQGARGIKLHPFLDSFPINDALLVRPIIDAAQENDLAVLFHCGEA
jgi:predicted TIM-barrel fold metal-dependent hydrolase